MKSLLILVMTLGVALGAEAQSASQSEEGARVLALDNSWNRALETNDTKALNMLLADSFVSIDIDGSIQTKGNFSPASRRRDTTRPRKR